MVTTLVALLQLYRYRVNSKLTGKLNPYTVNSCVVVVLVGTLLGGTKLIYNNFIKVLHMELVGSQDIS